MSRIALLLLAALAGLATVALAAPDTTVLELVDHPELMQGVVLPRLQDSMVFYPFEAQQAGERGMVRITFIVHTDGTVSDVKVTGPSQYWRLNDAAVQSALTRSYQPATRDGVPVAVRIWAIHNFNADPARPDGELGLDPATDVKLSCRYGTHHIAVDACTALMNQGTAPARMVLYPRAHAYEELGQYDHALADYDRLIGYRPDKSDLYISRGFSHEALGQYDKAAADYDRAATLDAKSVVALFDRGFAHMRLGSGDAATADFKAAMAARPRCATEEVRGVGMDWKKGPWSGSDPFTDGEDPTRAGMNAPQGGGPGSAFGPDKAREAIYTHNNTEQGDGARRVIVVQEACKASWVPDLTSIPDIKEGAPDELQRREYRCWARAVSNKWLDLALDDCNRALTLNPGWVRAHATRGLVYFRKGDYAAARQDFDAALARNPKLASALYLRGLAGLKTGDVAGAEADIFAARAADPEIASTYSRYNISP